MRKTVERLAVTAGAFVATGVAATLLKNNAQDRRKALRQDIEPFGTVRGFGTDVIADDGVAINVEVDPGPIPTVVFVHGWMCDIDTWHFQRLALRGKARMVFMDLRSHGRSGKALLDRCTIDDLADDLHRVINELAPSGPVVLVGHSMGGMTIQRLAGKVPTLFGERVVGTVLISTSYGGLGNSSPALRSIGPLIRSISPVLDWGREFNSYSIIKRWAVGPNASPTAIDLTNEMIMRAPTSVVVDFYPLIAQLDVGKQLDALDRVQTTILSGSRALMTPPSHSKRLAAAIPSAELITIRGAGHMVMFEAPQQVSSAIEKALEPFS
ncbi:MAG: alpha/beta hydrolase [Actinomycetales bacterium]|nr:alpha/beta hydrolase [Actinomycetales bacterium]